MHGIRGLKVIDLYNIHLLDCNATSVCTPIKHKNLYLCLNLAAIYVTPTKWLTPVILLGNHCEEITWSQSPGQEKQTASQPPTLPYSQTPYKYFDVKFIPTVEYMYNYGHVLSTQRAFFTYNRTKECTLIPNITKAM